MRASGVVGHRVHVVVPVTGLVHDHRVRPAIGVGRVGADVDTLHRVVRPAAGVSGRAGERLPGIHEKLVRGRQRAVHRRCPDPLEHVHPAIQDVERLRHAAAVEVADQKSALVDVVPRRVCQRRVRRDRVRHRMGQVQSDGGYPYEVVDHVDEIPGGGPVGRAAHVEAGRQDLTRHLNRVVPERVGRAGPERSASHQVHDLHQRVADGQVLHRARIAALIPDPVLVEELSLRGERSRGGRPCRSQAPQSQ